MTQPFDRIGRRDLRLFSGLVLFTYLTVHLVDHALGLVSLDVAEVALRFVVGFWHSPPGTVLLYGAAGIHIALAFLAVYERRTLRMPALQGLRIVLGLWMPVVLIAHFTGTRVAYERFGQTSDYAHTVVALWAPQSQGRQLALLVPGWIHGCLGLKFAFGGRKWYRRALPVLFGASLLLPVLAGLGFLSMGRELAHAQAALPPGVAGAQPADHQSELEFVRGGLLALYCGAIALVLVARQVRWMSERRRDALITIAYPGRTVQVPRGWSVLEASRSFGIPHLSLCGGNARCSTCRVRLVSGAGHCPPPGAQERKLLLHMRVDTDVRLACQLRPGGNVGVVPLVTDAASVLGGSGKPPQAVERTAAILVADLKRSGMSKPSHRSAHDMAYALNLFYEAFGDAVIAAGGTLGGHGGHEAMAIFGQKAGLEEACKQALAAMAAFESAVQRLNARLTADIGALGELVLAAHAGSVVVGHMGHRDAKVLTAVGLAVDVTRRLRDHAQRDGFGCVISQALLQGAQVKLNSQVWHEDLLDESGEPLRVRYGATSTACLANTESSDAALPP